MRTRSPRSSLGVRCLFCLAAALIVTSPSAAFAQPTERPVLQQTPLIQSGEPRLRIERFLDGTSVRSVIRRRPSYTVPFRRDLSSVATAVMHDAAPYGLRPRQSMRSFFTRDGRFLGGESAARIEDPRRLPPSVVQQGMSETGSRIVGAARLPQDFDIREVWEVIGTIVPLGEIDEFNLYPVDYELPSGETVPVVIVNIWGPKNPLGMPDDLPDVLKDRIRVIYYVNQKTWEADNLL